MFLRFYCGDLEWGFNRAYLPDVGDTIGLNIVDAEKQELTLTVLVVTRTIEFSKDGDEISFDCLFTAQRNRGDYIASLVGCTAQSEAWPIVVSE